MASKRHNIKKGKRRKRGGFSTDGVHRDKYVNTGAHDGHRGKTWATRQAQREARDIKSADLSYAACAVYDIQANSALILGGRLPETFRGGGNRILLRPRPEVQGFSVWGVFSENSLVRVAEENSVYVSEILLVGRDYAPGEEVSRFYEGRVTPGQHGFEIIEGGYHSFRGLLIEDILQKTRGRIPGVFTGEDHNSGNLR